MNFRPIIPCVARLVPPLSRPFAGSVSPPPPQSATPLKTHLVFLTLASVCFFFNLVFCNSPFVPTNNQFHLRPKGRQIWTPSGSCLTIRPGFSVLFWFPQFFWALPAFSGYLRRVGLGFLLPRPRSQPRYQFPCCGNGAFVGQFSLGPFWFRSPRWMFFLNVSPSRPWFSFAIDFETDHPR